MTASLTVERIVPATPDRVWTAWMTADGLAAWWWRHLPGTTIEVDARVGGAYRIVNAAAGIGVRGEFLEVDEPVRFRATWIWLDDDIDGALEHIDVSFAAAEDATVLTIVHSGPWTTGEPATAYQQGWDDTLPALSAQFA